MKPATRAAIKTVFRKGMKVTLSLTGAGFTTQEKKVVLRVVGGKVWLDNGPGNDPSGPFDATTGKSLEAGIFGFSSLIEPI